MKKVIMLLLAASLVSVMVSCGDTGETAPPDADKALTPDAEAPEEATAEIIRDDLPDDLDFGGHIFSIYTRENTAFYNTIIEEEIGEVLNDSIYHRTRNVEDRLNINFVESTYTDANAPRRLLLAGDNAHDKIIARCSHAFTFWVEGLTYEVDQIPNIDLSKPYWHTMANESISLNKRQHVAIGSANLTFYDFARVLLFNKQLIADFDLELPYGLVNSGKWTVDEMDRMMKAVISDLNGDGVMDINDRFGYLARGNDVLPAFWIAAGARSVDKDADDVPYFAAGSERFISIFDRVFDILWDTGAWWSKMNMDANVPTQSIQLFMQGQSLFIDCQVSYISDLRGMETDFGIIPYPKYDEQQENYYGRAAFYDAFVVGRSNPDIARTGAVIEAMNSESHKTVMPVYYELCLKTRTSRDDESEAMIDLIFNNLVIDLGDSIWVDKIRDSVFAGMFGGNNRNIASRLEAMERSVQSDINKILDIE